MDTLIRKEEKQMSVENEQLIMTLIVHSGDAKSLAMQSIISARKGEIDEANKLIQQANDAVVKAHEAQFKLLSKEANGECVNFSLMLSHSQDHLMNTITTIDLAKEMLKMWEEIHKIRGKL